MKNITKLSLGLIFSAFLFACGAGQADGVFFENLEDGQTVSLPLTVKMGVKGMEIEPAGEVNKDKGHHHIIIDGQWLPTGEMVPANNLNIHYGKGQTEAVLTGDNLTPGEHALTLQFANGFHQSYGEAWSKTITVVVE
jgi:hypothetical protein